MFYYKNSIFNIKLHVFISLVKWEEIKRLEFLKDDDLIKLLLFNSQ